METEPARDSRAAVQEWQARLAEQVGERVAHFRQLAGMTGQDLARKTGLDRAVISKLEKGHRQTLTVGDVFIVARALEVPPLLLLFPLGQAEEAEVLPGVWEDTWTAVKRFIGENGTDTPGVVDLFRDHEHYFRRFMEAYRAVVKMQNADLAEAGQLYERMRREDLPPLRRTRQMIRAKGLTPPPMPEAIPAYLGIDLHEGNATDATRS